MDKELSDKHIHAVKDMLKKSRKGALSLAVAFTISASVTGCTDINRPADSSYFVTNSRMADQPSDAGTGFDNTTTTTSSYANTHHYYHGGGCYYYGRGSTYRGGSWGTSASTINKNSGGSYSSKSGYSGGYSKGAGG